MTAFTSKTLFASALLVSLATSSLIAEENRLPHQHIKPETADLVERLKAGGYVLVVRHERTNAFTPDDKAFQVENCASQRNLSVAGHANAIENGAVIRFLDIPIGNVLASPMCRTLETGRLMFGHVESNDTLFGWGADPEKVRQGFTSLILENAGTDKNTALVTHLGTYSFVLGGHLAEGDTAVFGVSDGAPLFLGTIPANGWNDAIIDASIASEHHKTDNHGHTHN